MIDVELVLFARQDLVSVGLAPLTSMYLFGSANRAGFDDFRDAVHDSDGLQIQTGGGERIWRPLTNPRELQVSAFADRGPLGFGLLQRERRFEEYEDLEARYDKRPSVWIESVGAGARGRSSWSRSRARARPTTTSSPSGDRSSRSPRAVPGRSPTACAGPRSRCSMTGSPTCARRAAAACRTATAGSS
ncbi:MAG: hypothetical protein HC871_17675 [Rhizobiales bacterium]|nr:hypothetical protein [Hyphomicrobiales bacterium]